MSVSSQTKGCVVESLAWAENRIAELENNLATAQSDLDIEGKLWENVCDENSRLKAELAALHNRTEMPEADATHQSSILIDVRKELAEARDAMDELFNLCIPEVQNLVAKWWENHPQRFSKTSEKGGK